MLSASDVQAALQVAIFAVVFSEMLARPKMIFERYGRWLDKLEATRPKLAYPLGYCSKCLAGQIAFWMFPVLNSESLAYAPVEATARWVSFVSCTILFSALLSALWAFLKR